MAEDGPDSARQAVPTALEMEYAGAALADQSTAEPTVADPSRPVPPTAAERDRFGALLRDAVGSGVLSLEEFESRLDAVYSARSIRELEELVRWLPPPSRQSNGLSRSSLGVIAAAIVVVIAFGAVLIAARSGNGSAPTQSPGTTAPPLDASQTAVPPVITGVVPVSPLNDGKHYPRVYVDWPKGTKQGCVTSLNYSECSAGAPDSITFQTPILDPLSFRAVACFVVKNCDPQATDYEGPDEILGPWYRPRIDGSLLTLTPAAPLVQKDPVKKVYHLYVSLAQQPKAPAYAVYRNGVPVAILFVGLWTESCKPGVLCFDDEVMGVTGSTISYAVSACYSDCDPQSIQSGFAPATSPGPAVSVPGLVGT